jgi:signal transduction histidine kinase
MLWLSVLASVYLKMARSRLPETRRPSLDLIFAFLGAYRRAEILRRNLVEWEGRYSTVVEHTSDWIFVMDRDGVLISANAAAREHVGTVSDRDRRATELFSRPDGGAIGWESLWTEVCERAAEAAGSRSLSREWATHASAEQAKPEAPLQLDVQISPATLEGTLVAIGIARDVTEQRRIEREKEALQERLATIQRLESVGLLAGGIAHDFNNLLHTVQAAIERLRQQQDGPEKTHELLQTIEHAAERASRLTSHLLGFARQGKYNPERLLLQELLEEVRSLFDPLAGETAEFRLVRTPESIYLTADRRQLEQVLLNMLINSRDAVRQTDRAGRIVLRGERASHHTPGWNERPPERADANPATFCCIRVKDNGTGVPEDVRNTLFDPFVTTKEVGQGTGMGLAMAYGCVTHHEGWIHLESNARGTEFLVYLPCSR